MMSKMPRFEKTQSAKTAAQLIKVFDLPSWEGFDLKTRLISVEALMKAMYATMNQFGMYNDFIFARYESEERRNRYLKKLILKLKKSNQKRGLKK